MTKPKKIPWWQLPAILTGSLAVLTALGTIAVNYAIYAGLPARVEAGEVQNDTQDKQIDRLITLQEYYQKQRTQPPPTLIPPVRTRPQPRPVPIQETDAEGHCWQCAKASADLCWEPNIWEPCP